MAEFQDVMRQAKRMCKTHTCGDCPLRTMEGGCRMCFPPDEIGDQRELEAVQRIVIDWAAKNPEPRYPSWHEAWKQLFPDGQGSPCPAAYGIKHEPEWCSVGDCKRCKNRPIPADIAEKLGIKPIGGAIDEK